MTLITTAESLLEILTGQNQPKPVIESDSLPCPKCGLSIQQFNISGKFGCPYCYTHFRDEFLSLSTKHQHSYSHEGKQPQASIKKAKEYDEQVKLLKLRLAKAKELEKFDEAKKIKDELDKLILDNQ